MTTDRLFGRTMDFPPRTPWHLTYLPASFTWRPASEGQLQVNRYRILGGMRHFDGHYLAADGINEAGLICAELFFPVAAVYADRARPQTLGLTPQDFIMWVLGGHASVAEVAADLKRVTLIDERWYDHNRYPFHWLLQDASGTWLLEPLGDRLRLVKNPVAVLTNTPDLTEQVTRLNKVLGRDGKDFSPAAVTAYQGPWPQGGNSADRFQRAALCRWQDCPRTNSEMVAFLKKVTVPHTPRHEHNYTHYWAVVDVKSSRYSFTDLHTGCLVEKSLTDLNSSQVQTFA